MRSALLLERTSEVSRDGGLDLVHVDRRLRVAERVGVSYLEELLVDIPEVIIRRLPSFRGGRRGDRGLVEGHPQASEGEGEEKGAERDGDD
jgi:hypothetical protein